MAERVKPNDAPCEEMPDDNTVIAEEYRDTSAPRGISWWMYTVSHKKTNDIIRS